MPNFIIVRRVLQRPSTTVHHELERDWHHRWGRSRSLKRPTTWRPHADVHEYDHEYLIKVELAGMRDGDIEVTVDDGVLTIQGQRVEQRSENVTRIHELSINYGQFQLDFALNVPLQADAILARYDDGILYVTLPKQPPSSRESRRIMVTVDETKMPKQ